MSLPVILAVMALQAAAPACGATDADLPAALAAWRAPAAAADPLHPGEAATVALRPIETLTPVAPPRQSREGGTTTGALIVLEIAEAGTYGIALDSAAWIEIVRDGQPVASAAHGHGPACSSIRKIVDFALVPGRYTIQLSGTQAATARLLAIRR